MPSERHTISMLKIPSIPISSARCVFASSIVDPVCETMVHKIISYINLFNIILISNNKQKLRFENFVSILSRNISQNN